PKGANDMEREQAFWFNGTRIGPVSRVEPQALTTARKESSVNGGSCDSASTGAPDVTTRPVAMPAVCCSHIRPWVRYWARFLDGMVGGLFLSILVFLCLHLCGYPRRCSHRRCFFCGRLLRRLCFQLGELPLANGS